MLFFFFFFFQAEDGIRDLTVTGVQTCALPISGAALGGLRPVADVQYGDFLFLAMDQLANHAAKLRYMSGGKLRDRKSTRLNSSHSQISYAVFCLKKKKKKAQHVEYMPRCDNHH